MKGFKNYLSSKAEETKVHVDHLMKNRERFIQLCKELNHAYLQKQHWLMDNEAALDEPDWEENPDLWRAHKKLTDKVFSRTNMTTRVDIKLPAPNHKRVKITALEKNADGAWVESPYPQVLNHGDTSEMYIYDSRRILIEEVD